MGVESHRGFLAKEIVVTEVGANATGRKIVPSKRDRGESNVFKPGTLVVSRFPVIKDILIALYKLLYKTKASQSVCKGMMHNEGKKGALRRPYEQDLERDMRGDVDRERNVIVHIVTDCLLDGEVRIGKGNLLYDIFSPHRCVFPAVTEPALVRGVVVDQDAGRFGIVTEGSVQGPVGNVRAYFALQRHYPRVDKMKAARNTLHAVAQLINNTCWEQSPCSH
jgi:hypothetical protein